MFKAPHRDFYSKKIFNKVLSSDFINEYSIESIAKTHDSYYYSSFLKIRLNLNKPNQSILNLETLRAKLVKYSKKINSCSFTIVNC